VTEAEGLSNVKPKRVENFECAGNRYMILKDAG